MLSQQDDRQLVERTLNGCLDAFGELVVRYQARLLSFLSFYSSDRHSLEDIAQEAFLAAYRNLHQFDLERSFSTWLFTIARRLLSKRRQLDASDDALSELTCHREAPDARLAMAEQRTMFWRQIRAAVTDDEFQLLWFYYAEQFALSDVAEMLGVSYDVCKKRLSRLRQRLRESLSPMETLRLDAESHDADEKKMTLRRAG